MFGSLPSSFDYEKFRTHARQIVGAPCALEVREDPAHASYEVRLSSQMLTTSVSIQRSELVDAPSPENVLWYHIELCAYSLRERIQERQRGEVDIGVGAAGAETVVNGWTHGSWVPVTASTPWVGRTLRKTAVSPDVSISTMECQRGVFETVVFGGEFDQQEERYPTERSAVVGHFKWVAKCREALKASRPKVVPEDPDAPDRKIDLED